MIAAPPWPTSRRPSTNPRPPAAPALLMSGLASPAEPPNGAAPRLRAVDATRRRQASSGLRDPRGCGWLACIATGSASPTPRSSCSRYSSRSPSGSPWSAVRRSPRNPVSRGRHSRDDHRGLARRPRRVPHSRLPRRRRRRARVPARLERHRDRIRIIRRRRAAPADLRHPVVLPGGRAARGRRPAAGSMAVAQVADGPTPARPLSRPRDRRRLASGGAVRRRADLADTPGPSTGSWVRRSTATTEATSWCRARVFPWSAA